MSDEKKDAKVLAAAKRLAKAYLKYGKELETELDALADAAIERWPELEKLG